MKILGTEDVQPAPKPAPKPVSGDEQPKTDQ